MSLHDDVLARMRIEHEALQDLEQICPSTLALRVFEFFKADREYEIHLRYASLEHLKQIARGLLAHAHETAKRFEDMAAAGSPDMFAELLQDRYPIHVPKGAEPQYKLRDRMTDAELLWNERKLMRTSDALAQHARALAAYREERARARMGEIAA